MRKNNGLYKMTFEAEVKYDKENTKKLCEAVRRRFHFWSDISLYLLSAVLIGSGFYRGLDDKVGLVLALCGCLLLPNANYLKKQFTSKMTAYMEGWWPTVHYRFMDNGVEAVTDRGLTKTGYDKFMFLEKEEDYYFLYDSKNSAFMVKRTSISPGNAQLFEMFIAEKTNLGWKKARKRIRLV